MQMDGAHAHRYPAAFAEALERHVAQSVERSVSGVLLLVSVQNLAMIIHAHGYATSEKVMCGLAQAIARQHGTQDSVFRLERDLLAVILAECTAEDAHEHATAITEMAQNFGNVSGIQSLHVMTSIGSVDFPVSGKRPQQLVDKAFIALSNMRGAHYSAYRVIREEGALCRQQMGLANYLRKAIQENRLRLAFQPIICSSTGEVVHYEALLRLIGDDGKISSAGPLIPIAERMGMIDMIDHMVLDMVLEELQTSPSVVLAFNVSNMTTDNPHWLQHITEALKDRPELAARLIVEITETVAQRDLRRSAYFVACLQELGCQVALDDFGSGYTSFRQLKALSVDMVKIDGAFVRDLVSNADNQFFVKTLLEFSRGFGLKTVAEFVENGETAKMLMGLGVEYLQGFYFAKLENYRSWLNKGEYTQG